VGSAILSLLWLVGVNVPHSSVSSAVKRGPELGKLFKPQAGLVDVATGFRVDVGNPEAIHMIENLAYGDACHSWSGNGVVGDRSRDVAFTSP
jgi:hypothetical protein